MTLISHCALVRPLKKNNSLYRKAKYVWELPEYENWKDYYTAHFPESFEKVYDKTKHTGMWGGIDDAPGGSGAIVFAFRDYLLKEQREVLESYDRIILTRADHYYIDVHPILPLGQLYIVEGEDYDGVCDRHHIFDSSMCDDALGICDYLCNESNYDFSSEFKRGNTETTLLKFFIYNGIDKRIKRCKRVQFGVWVNLDKTRGRQVVDFLPGSNTLRLKYHSEYIMAKSNLNFWWGIRYRLVHLPYRLFIILIKGAWLRKILGIQKR